MKILNKLELMSPSIKVGGSNGYVVELPENAGALLTEESTNSLISTAKTEAISESKNYTDQKVSSVYRVKGSVPSIEDLPNDAEIGDVYNISDDLGGHNYVKTENGWDKLGGTVDLSPYALKTDVSGCVADLEGKITAAQNSAVSTSNAYTDACFVAANLSQYAKAEDVYTKGEVDDGFLKARTSGGTVKVVEDHVHFTGSTYFIQTDGSREMVIDVPVTITSHSGGELNVYGETTLQDKTIINGETTLNGATTISGDTTVNAPVEFTDSVSFSQIPTINSKNVATTDQIPDAYTKTEADSTFVKIGDATTGDVCADKVEADYLKVVCGEFGALTICGQDVATKIYVNDSLCNYLPIDSCYGPGYCIKSKVDFVGEVSVDGVAIATQSYVDDYVSDSISNIKYLPAAQCGDIDPYIVCSAVKFTETLTYGESEVATVADIQGCVDAVEAKIPTDYLPATKINDSSYDASSIGFTLFGLTVVCGVILPVNTRVGGEFVATKPYVDQVADQAEIDAFCAAQSYTDEKIASLGSVLEYKGNKTYAELPTEGNEVGDVYNITADYAEKGIKAGDNVVWNGSDWDVLSAPIDLSGYYDKEEVDAALEGYLPVESGCNDAYSYDSVNKALRFYNNGIEVMRLCGAGHVVFPTPPVDNNGSEFTTKSYVDAQVKTATDAITTLSGCVYTKDEVESALEGYYEVVEGVQFNSSNITLFKSGSTLVSIGSEENEFWRPVSYKGSSEISEDTHLTPKSYVDNLVSTSISVANSNIVYDEDFVLGDGTFDASTSQMKWTVSPEGATKILSVIALDGEGNLVHPSYKWANNTLTVSIFAEAEQDNPGYTVTVSYKK